MTYTVKGDRFSCDLVYASRKAYEACNMREDAHNYIKKLQAGVLRDTRLLKSKHYAEYVDEIKEDIQHAEALIPIAEKAYTYAHAVFMGEGGLVN